VKSIIRFMTISGPSGAVWNRVQALVYSIVGTVEATPLHTTVCRYLLDADI